MIGFGDQFLQFESADIEGDLVITDKMVTILLLYASGYQATTRTRNIRLGLFVIFAQKVVDEF